jgi:acylpyruvate hydrolase
MRLATIRTAAGARAVRVDADRAVETGHPDVGSLLADPDWRAVAAEAEGPVHGTAGFDLAPVIPAPGKIVCVGLNYRNHILEMGRELPQYPALFAKYAEALIGAHDDIALDRESSAVDWEAELALVIGRPVRRADEQQAAAAIAGFTVMNDVTMRDWQYRTTEWMQGKTFEGTTPLGPMLVTPEELPGGVRPALPLSAALDGETVQKAETSDLVFDPVALVRYVSTILTLRPGDVIATGTPGGVGHARTPPRYLTDGRMLVTEIGGIGRLVNRARSA